MILEEVFGNSSNLMRLRFDGRTVLDGIEISSKYIEGRNRDEVHTKNIYGTQLKSNI